MEFYLFNAQLDGDSSMVEPDAFRSYLEQRERSSEADLDRNAFMDSEIQHSLPAFVSRALCSADREVAIAERLAFVVPFIWMAAVLGDHPQWAGVVVHLCPVSVDPDTGLVTGPESARVVWGHLRDGLRALGVHSIQGLSEDSLLRSTPRS